MANATTTPSTTAERLPVPVLEELDIKLDMLVPAPWNKRPITGKRRIPELAASIESVGLRERIIVRVCPTAGNGSLYEYICGNRRYLAHKYLKRETIPCSRIDVDDRVGAEITFAENFEREDMHCLEEALQLEGLKKAGYSNDDLSAKFGKPPAWIARRLSLMRLTTQWKDEILDEESSASSWSPLTYESIARYEPYIQEYIFAETKRQRRGANTWDRDQHFAADQVSTVASHKLRLLSKMPWDPEDAVLVPKAGACLTCIKRISCQKDLFEGVKFKETKDGRIPKDDTCLDGACYDGKLVAHGFKEVAKLDQKAIAPITVLASRDGKAFDELEKKCKAESRSCLGIHDGQVTTKNEARAELCFNLTTGHTEYRIFHQAQASKNAKPPEPKAKRKHKAISEMDSKVKRAERRFAYVIDRVDELIGPAVKKAVKTMPASKVVAAMLCFREGGIAFDSYKTAWKAFVEVSKALDVRFKSPAIGEVIRKEAIQELGDYNSLGAYLGDLRRDQDSSGLEVVADLVGIDLKPLTAEALKEIPEPAAKPDPKPKRARAKGLPAGGRV